MSGYTSDGETDPNLEAELRPRRGASIRARIVIADAIHGARRMKPTTTPTSRRVKLEVEGTPDTASVVSLAELEESPNGPPSALPPTNTSATTVRAQKRRREVFDCVLIPVYKVSKRIKIENDEESVIRIFEHSDTEMDVDLKKTLKLWENPKVKKKKNDALLLPETIRSRIRHIGFDIQDQYFRIDQLTREVMVTRAFMSNVYGGSSQKTFPTPRAEKIKEHGINDFMFMNMDFQPQAPEVPGAPGLWFCPNDIGNYPKRRLFTKMNMKNSNNKWLYVGQYDVCLANPSRLSMEEWRAQPEALRNTWAKAIAYKGWGEEVCARILARKLYGGEPDDEEWEPLIKSGRHRETTMDEVKNAYYSGKERMFVWTLKCIGYDNKFQKEISERYPTWVPPPPKKQKGKGEPEETLEEEEEV